MTLPCSVTETPETDSYRVSEERLTYADLREANIARQAAWCPDQVPDLSFRGNELAGETGEVCNVIKKLERERLGWRGSRDTVEHLAEELADVVICADLCALSAGIDLNEAVAAKFNATSEKVGLPHRLTTPSLPPRSGGVVVKGLVDAAREVIDTRFNSYRAGNNRQVTIEGDDGEMCWIVPFDAMNELEDALARIRSTLADPIPEAPADEEVGGPNVGLARDEWLAAASSPQIERWALKWADVLLDALRRSTETDKPGVREAVLEEAAKVADMFAADHAKSADQFGIDRNRELHNAAKGTAQGVAFAIRALSASPLTEEQSAALQDVVAERKRQVQAEGWTPEHDDGYANGEMACAAGVYALSAGSRDYRWVLKGLPCNDYLEAAMKLWPWDWAWWKPTNRRRDLVKAGALIIAEIERLDRLPRSTTGGAK